MGLGGAPAWMISLTSGIPKHGQEIQQAQAHLETSSPGFATAKDMAGRREDHRSEDAAEALRIPGARVEAQGVFWGSMGMWLLEHELDYTLWHSCPSWCEGFTRTSKNTNQIPKIL